METVFAGTAIQDDIEASRHSDDKLVKVLVRMTAALGPARHIVEIVDSLDFERHMARSFDEREITTRIGNLWQIYEFAVRERHTELRIRVWHVRDDVDFTRDIRVAFAQLHEGTI